MDEYKNQIADWTWIWLMAYCKEKGIPPDRMDDLFKLVRDMRNVCLH